MNGMSDSTVKDEGGVDPGNAVAKSDIAIRDVTDEELEFYWEHGWVSLPSLISEEDTAKMYAEALRFQREAETLALSSDTKARTREIWASPSATSELFAGICYNPAMGNNAAKLMSSPIWGPRHAKRSMDALQLKHPGAAGGTPTPWHQDFPSFPLDRGGMLVIWIALVPMPPEMGTLRFVDKSHRLGQLGYFNEFAGEDPLTRYPGIAEHMQFSPPLTMRPGDATVHDALTLHHAPENTTSDGRWAYSSAYLPSDVQYTGAPNPRYSRLGLEVHGTLDHPEFPTISDRLPAAR
ncbi:phytanoyl-CoA dioxygenase family protein [Rhodococcus rhodochrous]|uniref:phytanoyl-CoA dioxygenase family protein n=1 Tax=Rhodococcus rhodochrous TaxID=1829 RepID=UPI0009B63798|nr:phytanoyl-CoA dioxygenase family protein [Rhodococcus rhodochrous]